ncbi:MAG: hypothetical protein KDC98_19365 [Planctomycetes bacterium]|nr:hypothetical protein [Planctomycetota bacterium]
MFCAKVEPIVNGLAQDYAGRMKFEIRPYDEGDAPELIRKHALDRHGMVITDPTGAARWKESGHKQTRAGVEAAIKQLLAE